MKFDFNESPEYFGVNGFYEAAPKAIGYFVAIVPLMAAEFFGYYVFKDCENKNMWIVLLIAIAAIGLALIGFVNVLKSEIPCAILLSSFPYLISQLH